ncbi:hypothetical protein ER308_16730 [Egibacter rhizosphaerae]|uniref:DUF2029 domain-containing protein n=1 Tax=Egibacter rhizosphaerae TaxID=1670831 RepID=A0A411YJ04_9ACTN|nr:hypothetical protein [Egibacter rhizosphaerae]QBI21056.1 hypothetical protein ER308_16730 [Egibacter rhizosphaerae]
MTDHSPDPANPTDRFERFAATVGDLDSDFYAEERQRDVWNEASAVGFQVLLWGVPLVATVLLWTVRASALVPVAALLVPWAVAVVTTLTYARRRGVDPRHVESTSAQPLRLSLFALVVAAAASGVTVAAAQFDAPSTIESFLRGAAQGGAFGLGVIALGALVIAFRERRRRTRAAASPEPPDEDARD